MTGRIKAGQVVAIANGAWPNGSKRFSATALVLESGHALTKVIVREVLTEHEAEHPERVRTRWTARVIAADDILTRRDPMTSARFKKLCEVYGEPEVRDSTGQHRALREPNPGATPRFGPIPAGAYYSDAPKQAPDESEQDYARRVIRMANTKGHVSPAGARRVFIGEMGRGAARRYAVLHALDLECAKRQPGVDGVRERWVVPCANLDDLGQDQLKAAYLGVQLPLRVQEVLC